MISYPTTLLPPSPPYDAIHTMIIVWCDRCLKVTDDPLIPPQEKEQHFDLTMSVIQFWENEEVRYFNALR